MGNMIMTTSSIPSPPCTVLLVEDNHSDAQIVKHALANVVTARYQVEHVTLLSAAIARLRRGGIDVALVDLSLPDSTSLETFQTVYAAAQFVPIVVVTGLDDERVAIGLLQHGAQDYLLKHEIEPKALARSIRYAIERSRATALESLNHQLEQAKTSLTTAVNDLKRTNEGLAQFAYFASHDLQEPVRKINAFAGHLQDTFGATLNDDGRKDIYFILDAGRRMQALISSLLALSQAGNADLEFGPVDLELCVGEVLECLAARIEAKGAVIVRDALPVVQGDPTLLEHLYQNLIGNALKFTNGKHPVVHCTAEPSGKHWILGVRDNGIGIEPELAQSVFAPFRRLNGREQYEGAGIGLTICHKVVDRHGGRIWVESKPGAGAHFRFFLPASEKSRMTGDVTVPSAPQELCLLC